MKSHPLRLLQISALILLGAGFYFPVLNFLSGSNPLHPEDNFLQWSFFKEFLSDPWNLGVILFSLYQAFLSAVLSILFGFPGAWLLTHYNFPGKHWFRLLTYLPFILPSILVVLAMVLFFGNNGWINRALMSLLGTDEPPVHFLYSLSGILIAHVFYNFPLAMKIIADQWENISLKYLQAARSLGAGNTRRFFGITFPLLLPSIGSAFVLIFLLCMNSFAIILVLGGGIRYTTIEVLIYQLARIELDFSGAASLAFLQGGLSLIGMAILLRGRDRRVEQKSGIKIWLPEKLRERSSQAWFALFWIAVVLIFALGPLTAIVVDSFRKFENGEWIYTVEWYSRLFSWRENNQFLPSLWNSLRIGFGSALLSSLCGLGLVSLIAYRKGTLRRFWEMLTLFPLALSTVVFGVAWFHFYQRHLTETVPLIFVVIAMHALLTCPYWIRVVLPTLETIPTQWHSESKMLGKNPFEYGFRILWPWLRKTLLIAFFFSFSLSLGELNSTMMIADHTVRTLPLEIYGAISGYRFSYASAVAVILLLLSVTTFLVVERSLGYFGTLK
ncbi:MAG: putative 2-aminoethylphosphonate transport system permease protein PhnU [Deltaproteobacteria bacterium]|nr:putative 2-aminoethylphosphonate transport system permease protein PhnU [Deltaproteobacteria bacterium]